MWKDLQFSIRTLLKQPTFAMIAILTLALGIGATAAVFSILNAVLVKELPYKNPDRLYMLRSMAPNGTPTGLMAPRFAEPFIAENGSVEAISLGWTLPGSIVASDGTPYPFMPYRVTPRFFDVFSDSIALGSGFKPNERGQSVIISYSMWQNYFASDPNIVGKAIRVDNGPWTVVGVARKGFEFPKGAQGWEPLSVGGPLNDLVNFEAYLKLRPGVSPERFKSELAALSQQLGPVRETGKPLTYVLKPLKDEVVGDLGSTVLILFGATALLLLIACLNVANLLFARANGRSHEIGLREAVGAGRFRVIRQLLTESLVLSAIGGILGVGLAFAAVRLLLGIGPSDLPRLGAVTIDRTVPLFSVAAVLLTTTLVGLAPAVRLSRSRGRLLIGRGRAGSAGRRENRIFAALVIAEVGLAVMLVVGAGLLVRSYVKLTTINPGFSSSRVLTVRMNATQLPVDMRYNRREDGTIEYSGTGYQRIANFYNEVLDRLRGIHGVVDVTSGQELPIYRNQTQASPEPFTIEGRPSRDLRIRIRPVSRNFFSTVGGRILAGRDFLPSDRRDTPGVGVINEAFARQYFPNENPIGKHLGLPSHDFEPISRGYGFAERLADSVEIVGVVSDINWTGLSEVPPPYLFMSADQFTTRFRVLAVKTTLDDPSSLVPEIRREIAKMAPTIPVEFTVYSKTVDASIARERLGTALLALFGAIALLLAAVGVYGVMTYSVVQRSGEIAIRTALGASSGQVVGMVLRRGIVLGLSGVLVGVAGSVALRRVIAGQLYGVSALDPGVLITVPLVLLVVALAASLIPALRASRIAPMAALRHE
jgi:predicted permease